MNFISKQIALFGLHFLAQTYQGFFGLAHFFGLNSAINLWKTKFSLKIFGIFLTNKMRDKITILALFRQESILSYELYKKCRTL